MKTLIISICVCVSLFFYFSEQKLFVDLSNRPVLAQREFIQVKILSGVSPKELFVMKVRLFFCHRRRMLI